MSLGILLGKMLGRTGISSAEIHEISTAMRKTYDPKHLRVGDHILLHYRNDLSGKPLEKVTVDWPKHVVEVTKKKSPNKKNNRSPRANHRGGGGRGGDRRKNNNSRRRR